MLFPNTGYPETAPQSLALLARIIPGFIAIFAILTAGVTSIISIIKYKDYALMLIIPVLIGLFGLMLVLGEFLIPH